MGSEIIRSLRMLIVLTVLTGVGYPILMTGVAQIAFPRHANGSLIVMNGQTRGSTLIGQSFERPEYFWSRPSATGYNPLPSSGSNLGPTSAALRDLVDSRIAALQSSHGQQAIPANLLFASGSGLDPHITPEAAHYQVDRVGKARGLNPTRIQQLDSLVDLHIEGRTMDFLGEPRVNVLALNLALDSL